MGKVVSCHQHVAHILFLQHTERRRRALHPFTVQPDVEHFHQSYMPLVFCKQKGEFPALQRQSQIGPDDVCPHVIGIVFSHQSRRHINTDNHCRRLVDVFHQRSKSSCQRLVQARTEQSVNHQHALIKLGRVKFVGHLYKASQRTTTGQALPVDLAVFRKPVAYVEQVDTHCIFPFCQHSGHSQSIAAIIARTCKHDHRHVITPNLGNGTDKGMRRTLHQVD